MKFTVHRSLDSVGIRCAGAGESFMDLAIKLLEEQMGITEQLPLPLDEKK